MNGKIQIFSHCNLIILGLYFCFVRIKGWKSSCCWPSFSIWDLLKYAHPRQNCEFAHWYTFSSFPIPLLLFCYLFFIYILWKSLLKIKHAKVNENYMKQDKQYTEWNESEVLIGMNKLTMNLHVKYQQRKMSLKIIENLIIIMYLFFLMESLDGLGNLNICKEYHMFQKIVHMEYMNETKL